jgi:hypothetical protein
MTTPPQFLVGLDLGQSMDHSALAVVAVEERYPAGTVFKEVAAKERHHAVTHLKRWPLGTSYPAIVRDVRALLSRPPLPGCRLVIDNTGVGRAVVDLFRQEVTNGLKATLVPVTITGGERPHWSGGGWSVPKKDLAGTLQVLLGHRRLKVAAFPERDLLLGELRSFRVKVKPTTGHEDFAAWRERDHDDLVLATAIACWLAERTAGGPGRPRFLSLGPRIDRKRLHIVACSREELATLEIADHPALLVQLQDPGAADPTPAAHGLGKVLGTLSLSFADVTPEEHRDSWDRPVSPYGKPVGDLLMSQTDGKRLWHFLRRRYDPNPEVIVLADGGDRRALSLAYTVCDGLGLARQGTVHAPGDPEADHQGPAPNRHAYETAKACRLLVV